MQMLLQQLNTVPGVVGSMVCDARGDVVAQVFPSLFDASMLTQAAKVLADSAAGLETVTGPLRLLDLRFGDARVVIKPLSGAFLLFLCASSMNLQPLAISTSVAAPKIERLLAGQAGAVPSGPGGSGLGSIATSVGNISGLAGLGWSNPSGQAAGVPAPATLAVPAPAAPAAGTSELWVIVQRIDAIIERRHLDRFRVRGEIAIKAGFGLGLIDEETPDDPAKAARLREVASAILGEPI